MRITKRKKQGRNNGGGEAKTLSMTPSTPVGRSLRLIFDDKDGEYGKKAHTRSGGLSGHQRTVLVHA